MPTIQVVLTRAEVSIALAQFAASQLPPGRKLGAEVFVFGTHPKNQSRASATSREALVEMFAKRGVMGGEKKPEDAMLADWGAIVALNEQPDSDPSDSGTAG